MRERAYQARLIKELRTRFPSCVILKNDSSYMQGVPDLIILYGRRWGMLEVKIELRARMQPNQEHYIKILDEMSFAAIICPDNQEEVLHALQLAFELEGDSRVS